MQTHRGEDGRMQGVLIQKLSYLNEVAWLFLLEKGGDTKQPSAIAHLAW